MTVSPSPFARCTRPDRLLLGTWQHQYQPRLFWYSWHCLFWISSQVQQGWRTLMVFDRYVKELRLEIMTKAWKCISASCNFNCFNHNRVIHVLRWSPRVYFLSFNVVKDLLYKNRNSLNILCWLFEGSRGCQKCIWIDDFFLRKSTLPDLPGVAMIAFLIFDYSMYSDRITEPSYWSFCWTSLRCHKFYPHFKIWLYELFTVSVGSFLF